jgi:hypothetical protein
MGRIRILAIVIFFTPIIVSGAIVYSVGVLIQSVGLLLMLDETGSKKQFMNLFKHKQ